MPKHRPLPLDVEKLSQGKKSESHHIYTASSTSSSNYNFPLESSDSFEGERIHRKIICLTSCSIEGSSISASNNGADVEPLRLLQPGEANQTKLCKLETEMEVLQRRLHTYYDSEWKFHRPKWTDTFDLVRDRLLQRVDNDLEFANLSEDSTREIFYKEYYNQLCEDVDSLWCEYREIFLKRKHPERWEFRNAKYTLEAILEELEGDENFFEAIDYFRNINGLRRSTDGLEEEWNELSKEIQQTVLQQVENLSYPEPQPIFCEYFTASPERLDWAETSSEDSSPDDEVESASSDGLFAIKPRPIEKSDINVPDEDGSFERFSNFSFVASFASEKTASSIAVDPKSRHLRSTKPQGYSAGHPNREDRPKLKLSIPQTEGESPVLLYAPVAASSLLVEGHFRQIAKPKLRLVIPDSPGTTPVLLHAPLCSIPTSNHSRPVQNEKPKLKLTIPKEECQTPILLHHFRAPAETSPLPQHNTSQSNSRTPNHALSQKILQLTRQRNQVTDKYWKLSRENDSLKKEFEILQKQSDAKNTDQLRKEYNIVLDRYSSLSSQYEELKQKLEDIEWSDGEKEEKLQSYTEYIKVLEMSIKRRDVIISQLNQCLEYNERLEKFRKANATKSSTGSDTNSLSSNEKANKTTESSSPKTPNSQISSPFDYIVEDSPREKPLTTKSSTHSSQQWTPPKGPSTNAPPLLSQITAEGKTGAFYNPSVILPSNNMGETMNRGDRKKLKEEIFESIFEGMMTFWFGVLMGASGIFALKVGVGMW